jgi:hypothetical protein
MGNIDTVVTIYKKIKIIYTFIVFIQGEVKRKAIPVTGCEGS